ncbi:MAG TPA: glycerol-3-phosphate dehydrogenase/oxidase [Stenomitos sp.]
MLSRELSATSRRVTLERLPKESWDLLVIGGGITGAGIALEGALRGLKVALVERDDFASGTSSKSSKLLHGGLRYLEHGEFRLVHEALTQRNKLFHDASHLAKELPFLFPIYDEYGDNLTVMNAGLWLYDGLSSTSEFRMGRLHRKLRPQETLEQEPTLRLDRMKGSLAYIDGLTEDARMTVETIKTAATWGAAIANHVEVTAFNKGPDGKVTGVTVRDLLSHETYSVFARRVINATGPWSDRLARLEDPEAKPRLKPTKGVHLVVRKFTEKAIVLKSHEPKDPKKKRWMFIIPYGERTIIGTTDTAHADDGTDAYLDRDIYASPAEIQYILDSANDVCPGANLKPEDVIASFAGWRPLIAPPGEGVSESEISREHEIFISPAGVIGIAGGKYTTYRSMARQVVEVAVKSLREEAWLPELANRHCDEVPLSGGDLPSGDFDTYLQYAMETHPTIEPSLIRMLVSRYGSNYLVILSLMQADRGLDRFIVGLSPETPLLRAEIAYFVRFEMAVTLLDVMMRRTRLNLLDAHQGLEAVDEIAAVMSGALQTLEGWTEEERMQWVEAQVRAYQQEIEKARAIAAGQDPKDQTQGTPA